MDSHDKKQTEKNRFFIQSVRHAIMGLFNVLQKERNFRFHVMIAILIIILGFVLALNQIEWILILGCIGAVMVAEVFNSAIERLADTITQGVFHPMIKQAKDVASAGVLVTTFFVAIIGLIIFLNKLF